MDMEAFRLVFGSGNALKARPPCRRLVSDADLEVVLTLCWRYRPRTFVEIGVFAGWTSREVLKDSPWVERYVGVDLAPDKLAPECLAQLTVVGLGPEKEPGRLAKRDPRFEMVLLDGPDALRPEMVAPADMVFIDGDHRYEAVRRDTAVARAALRDGAGILTWYDCRASPDVRRYVDERDAEGWPPPVVRVDEANVCFEIVGKGCVGRKEDGHG